VAGSRHRVSSHVTKVLGDVAGVVGDLPRHFGDVGDRGAIHCHWNVIAKLPIGLVPFQARCILSVTEEQNRPGSLRSGSIEDQPQYPGLWHRGSPSALSFSHSPSRPSPSLTQYPSPPCSLVRDGQTSPLRPRFVVSRSTCPLLSPSPHANSFVIGTAVINTHGSGSGFPAAFRPRVHPSQLRVCHHASIQGQLSSIVQGLGFR